MFFVITWAVDLIRMLSFRSWTKKKKKKSRFLQWHSYFLLNLSFFFQCPRVLICVLDIVMPGVSLCAPVYREQSCSWCGHVTRMKPNVWTREDNKWSRLRAGSFTPQCVYTAAAFTRHLQTRGVNLHLNTSGLECSKIVIKVSQEGDKEFTLTQHLILKVVAITITQLN